MTDAQAILIAALEDVTALAVCFEADRLTLRDLSGRIWGETPRTGDLTADVARLGRWHAEQVLYANAREVQA